MASCFPFMKYIFLLTLFIICFLLMYNPDIEYLGLGLFFLVNLLYSAMIGIDLSSMFTQAYSGNENMTTRWGLILAGILLIALCMNFASSILTMMTLSNLYYKFGKKGNPIMLSPTNRKQLDTIEGLFVSSIVLITILSFRIYFSPMELADHIFQWASENIPENYVSIGHLVLCIVVFGLAMSIIDIKLHFTVDEKGLARDFVINFYNLFGALISLTVLFAVPSIIMIWSQLFGTSDIESIISRFDLQHVSAYTLFKVIFIPLTLGVTAELYRIINDTITGEIINGIYNLFHSDTEGTSKDSTFISNIRAVTQISFVSMSIMLFTLTANALPNLWGSDLPTSLKRVLIWLDMIISTILIITVPIYLSKIQTENKQEISEISNRTKTELESGNISKPISEVYVYLQILSTLLLLFPIVIIIILWTYYQIRNDDKIFHTIFDAVYNLNNFLFINLVESFTIIKLFLVMVSIILAGFTMNSYAHIDIYQINPKLHFKENVIAFFVFVMITLSMSFFTFNSLPLTLTILIEYLSPIALLIIISLLVYYSNNMTMLSKDDLIQGTSIPFEPKPLTERDIQKDKINYKVFDGITHKI